MSSRSINSACRNMYVHVKPACTLYSHTWYAVNHYHHKNGCKPFRIRWPISSHSGRMHDLLFCDQDSLMSFSSNILRCPFQCRGIVVLVVSTLDFRFEGW